jgi:hypothetical protein
MACTGLIDIGSFVHCPTICTITHSFIANIFRGVINMPTPRDLRKFCFKIAVYQTGRKTSAFTPGMVAREPERAHLVRLRGFDAPRTQEKGGSLGL